MAEPKFIPKDGQMDFTHARYCPVINALVTRNNRILLFQRHKDMNLFPGHWHCIGGFLDDHQSVEEKIREELQEEAGITGKDIVSIRQGSLVMHDAPQYHKTFLVVPALVTVRSDNFTLNWESQAARWYTPEQALDLELMPGFKDILRQFFPAKT